MTTGLDDREDLMFIQAALEELDDYLGSEILYWRVYSQRLPLTPGNLLLTFRVTSVSDFESVHTLQQRFLEIKKRSLSKWQRKCLQEYKSRSKLWEELVTDTMENGAADSGYKYSVRSRVILSLISSEVPVIPFQLLEAVDRIDNRLSETFKTGEFIWETGLSTVFPLELYPYLYLDI